MNRTFFGICIFIISLLLTGCGSSSSSPSSNTQDVFFSYYTMKISSKFQSILLENTSNRKLSDRLIGAYSIPTSSKDYFEKNIVLYEDALGNVSFENYINQSLSAIDKTWWGYKKDSLNNFSILCGGSSLLWKEHLFEVTRGSINETWQIIYFAQYFLLKWNKITILSASTDDNKDLVVLQEYKNTIKCMSKQTTK